MKKMFKVLAVAMCAAMLISALVIPASAEMNTGDAENSAETAEEGNLEDDGEETITADNGATLSFNRYNWKVDIDEDGTVSGVYLGDAPEYVGFDIVRSTDTDAKAYMTEAAESYGVELSEGNFFNDDGTWYSFTNTVIENGSTTLRTVYARNNSDGAWIVTAYGYIDPDEEKNELVSDELSMVLDSFTFAD